MSDRYHGSAYRSRGGPYRDDRRYAPSRHPRDEHDYADSRPPYDARGSYTSSYYPEPRAYSERPHARRMHKAIPPPRPWDYSRRPPPRNEQERAELEREREAWEAKEEERYQQRMEERQRERQREWDRSGYSAYGASGRDRDAEAYDRDRARHAPLGPSRGARSRSPGLDPRYEQRGSWGRTSIGSSEGRERDAVGAQADRPDASGAYSARQSSPPPTSSSSVAAPAAPAAPAAGSTAPDSSAWDHAQVSSTTAATASWNADAPDSASASRYRPASPHATPRGPARDNSGFISTPPTGPRASRGVASSHASSAYRGREGSGSVGVYSAGSDREREASSYMSASNGRYRVVRDGAPPMGAYRGGHPSFGRGRRDTIAYDSHYSAGAEDDLGYRSGYGQAHAGSSPHENSPYSPSTCTAQHHHLAAPRLSRTSSSQTPTTPASAIPTGASVSTLPSPSTLAPAPTTTPHFCSAYTLTPDLDAELLALENQRTSFVSNYLFGSKRSSLRTVRRDLRDAELDYSTAAARRSAAERALEIAKETADAYSLEENRKDELQRLIAQQLQQQHLSQQPAQLV